MDSGKSIIGAGLILVALYLFFTQTNPGAQYLGAGVLLVIGVVILMGKKKKKRPIIRKVAPKIKRKKKR